MRKARWPNPTPRGAQRCAPAAGRAIARLFGKALVQTQEVGIVADTTLKIEAPILVGLKPVFFMLGVQPKRNVTLAVHPNLVPGRVLAQRRVQALLRRVATLRIPRVRPFLK